MKKIFIFIFLVSIIISFSACQKNEPGRSLPSYSISIGDIAPDFTLRTISGGSVSLSDYKGKVVMVEFWATWCPPCKDLAPELNKLYEKYRDKGFIILALAAEDEAADNVRAFAKEFGMTYPVLFATVEIIRRYGVSGIPVSFIIDREGKVVSRHIGGTPEILKRLTSEIEGLL